MYKVILSKKFRSKSKKLIKKYQSLLKEIDKLLKDLAFNPTTGVSLGRNCYKIRLPIESKGKGKSGGARVITFVVHSDKIVTLLSIYDKSEQNDITEKELSDLLDDVL
jgi:mRNA-degrading endonuclease RelE of RelBE toxin-antitoxin system